jgi:hypothetical protein
MFKKDDLLILNDLGIEFMYGKDNSETKKNKNTLYCLKHQKGERFIILESVDKTRNLGVWRADFFRLATPLEIKIFTVGEIFS